MNKYYGVVGAECSHINEIYVLWEDGMCCPKVCYRCRGPDTDAECDGGTNPCGTTSGDATVAAPGEDDSDETHSF